MPSFTHPVERAPAGSVPLPVIRGSLRTIKLSQIKPSKLNPREKADDRQGVLDLASSIEERGLLQNLVVRPIGKDGSDQYELMGGERRWHALKHLKVDQIEVKVISADDATSIATQLVENMDRRELTPMEEANAFAQLQALDQAHYTTAEIARMVGKTERFVQQRLAMARNLAPEVRELLAKGEIKVEAARVLASAPVSTQKQIVEEGARHGWEDIKDMSADELRQEINDLAVPLDKAAFDVALYTGQYIEEGKAKRFADVEMFDTLQLEAARGLVAKLRQEWPKASIVKAGALQNWCWADNKANLLYGEKRKGTKAAAPYKIAQAKVTAIVWIANDKSLHRAEGVTKAENFRSTTTHTSGPSIKPETPEHAAARQKFSADLRAAALKKAKLVKCLTVLALLDSENEAFDEASEDEIAKAAPHALKPFLRRYWFRDDDKAKALKVMEGLKPAELDRMIATLAVAQVNWPDHPRQMPADIKAIAATLGIKFVEPKPAPPTPAPEEPDAKEAPTAKGKAKPKAKTAAKKKAASSRKKL